MAVWLVRAGAGGEHESYALDNGVAIIGWWEDFSGIKSKGELLDFLIQQHPNDKVNKLKNHANQIWAFKSGMQVGDTVALPLKHRPVVAFGKLKGGYLFKADAPKGAQNQRAVEWFKEVPRTQIAQDILYSLGAFLTVCKIWRNDAEPRIAALLAGKPDPLGVPAGPPAALGEDVDEGVTVDLEEVVRDQIRAVLYSKFKGHGLARLVAAVLDVQGYKTQVSPAGADGGVDVVAGTGPLGFESPRLVVQVKSEQTPIDVGVVRELQGVMKRFGADHGLIVAWGGFKSSVIRETASEYFEIRLWTGDDLVQGMLDSYDKLPDDIRAELPLKRIWTLVPDQES